MLFIYQESLRDARSTKYKFLNFITRFLFFFDAFFGGGRGCVSLGVSSDHKGSVRSGLEIWPRYLKQTDRVDNFGLHLTENTCSRDL
jgi:hypothetical protein